jgi:glycosyltransferase involved in cell wall biosynthesis
LARGAVRHKLRPLFRAVATKSLKKQCARASAVSYVTEFALQRRYPAGQDRFVVAVSDAELNPLSFSSSPRVFTANHSSTDLGTGAYADTPQLHTSPAKPRLLFIGSLEQMYKGPDVLLNAVALLKQRGVPVRLAIVGDGRHRLELEQLSRSLELSQQVAFYGELPAGTAICEQLDWASLFVLPSRTEGLPRVLVEAMARALPCIATTVGGIPELLAKEDMVPPNHAGALADKIHEVISSPERMNAMSARNLARAQEFRPELLQQRRTEFYRFLHDVTRDWLASRSRVAA